MKWKITGFITFFLIFVMPIFQVAGIGIKSVANDVQSSVENETPLINNGSDLEYAPSSIVSEAVTFDQKMSNAHSVAVKYGNWFDSARNRYVPVKIYYPHKTSSHCPIILFSHGLGGS
ncbi:MAG: hypothetical protein LBQ54_02015, partial [Planctomycetaceae bacterium]|nr:hypothetical protein [Planctomycetaceae bacterium]